MGLAVPGDRVDLILTMDVPAAKGGPARHVSETVLQDIRVLAVDQKIDDQSHDAPLARTATLEVTPKEAEVVTLLNEMGKLSMTLRSVGSAENDAQPHHPTLTWDTDAVEIPFMHHQSIGPSAGNQVEIVRGTSKSSVEFTDGRAVETAAAPSSSPASAIGAAGAATSKAIGAAGRAIGQ